jgi:sugar phosphate permease
MVWKRRYLMLAVVFSGFLLCYLDRMVMATAIPFMAQDLHFSPVIMGQVLSAFFVGYAAMQIPGGLLADRVGPRAVLSAGIAWWSIMTALTGAATGLAALVIVRVLFGIGEGPFPPAASKTLAIWFPRSEVGRASGLQFAASSVGATLAPLFAVALISRWGWRSVFYALFAPGAILAVISWLHVRDSPAASQRVDAGESRQSRTETVAQGRALSHLKSSLQTPGVLWCAATLFLSNMVAWGLMSWLPTYLLRARQFGAEAMSVFAALTNLGGALGYVAGGYLCDRYFSQKLRIPIVVGSIIAGGATYLAANASSGEWAVTHLVLVFFFSNVSAAAILMVPIVVVPPAAVGGAFGIVNTAGQIAGVLSPLVIGYLLEATNSDFKLMLYLLVALSLVCACPALGIRQPKERPAHSGCGGESGT